MAEIREKENRSTPAAGFTDGDYIPRDEAPNMPRVFSNTDAAEQKAPDRRMMPMSMAVMLCMLTLFLGLWLGSSRKLNGPAAPDPVPESETETERGLLAAGFSSPEDAGEEYAESSVCLGISVQTVTPAAAGYYKLYTCDGCVVEGAQIYALAEDGAAESAGLRAGDILIALDGLAVRSAAELSRAESRYQAGEQALCTVFRDGDTVELPVVFQIRQPRSSGDEDGLYW